MSSLILSGAEQKIRRDHRQRLAVVYVRQSTVHQVQHHQESTQLQYGLVDLARRWGWPQEQVLVIDEDLGISGASAEGRAGFQRLLGEVALNHVGLILGVEMSRLARCCKDWYQLLELCALYRTLIADLDGLYDPTSYNDRLLLGLKGTMSEAELHILKQRMLQGALQKARRGELISKVPIGYVRDATGQVQLDPDEQARHVVQLVFTQFTRIGSASGVLRWLARHEVKLPVRLDNGPAKGSLEWRRPSLTTVRNLLTNPLYAGAYAYGRSCQNPTTRRIREVSQRLPQDKWQVLLPDRHPAYITWDQFQQNVAQLAGNQAAHSGRGAVRSGRALLPGLLVCGRCGCRMTTRYQGQASQPRYVCEQRHVLYGQDRCQGVAARTVDDEVARLALLALAPASLEVSLAVASDVEQQREGLERHWQDRLMRARYDADRARRQYDAVDPENRLVARSLEQAWEQRLRELNSLEQEHQRACQSSGRPLSLDERDQILQLATDLPALWKAVETTDIQRKQILQQLLEQVVVTVEGVGEWVELRVCWSGGQQTYSRIRRPVGSSSQLAQWPELQQRLRALKASGLSSPQIAEALQAEGFKPAKGNRITPEVVRIWLSRYGLTARRNLAQETADNEWTIPQLIDRYQLPTSTIYGWIRQGRVAARQVTGPRGRWLIQASPQEIQLLLHRRKRPQTTDDS